MRPSTFVLGFSALSILAATGCQDLPVQTPPPHAGSNRIVPTQAMRTVAIVSGITMVDLGPALRVDGINDSGYVVGQSVNQLAAVWSPSGAMQEIRATCPPACWLHPFPGCDSNADPFCADNPVHDVPSEATAINNEGQVVGYYRYNERLGSGDYRGGFVWSSTVGFTDFWPHHNGTFPYAINDSGQMAGSANFTPSSTWTCCGHAFRRSALGAMTDLGTVGGGTSFAYAIDSRGDVAGISPGPMPFGQAILWPASGGYVLLGAPGGASIARGINDSGIVVGYWDQPYPGATVAFRWTQADGLRVLPGGLTARAVNRDGYIVGDLATPNVGHAGLWTPDGQTIDLGSLGRTTVATAINSRLQVAGYGVDAAGVTHAVRWDVTVIRNRPPVAEAGGPYAGMEGSPIAFTGSASDPDGDPLTLSWSFGDGAAATGPTASHSYADNGSYTVVLTATDPLGATATSSTVATVANVAPTVHVDPPAPIVSGGSFTLHATFTDPGTLDMPWRYTIDWGTASPTTGSATSEADPLIADSPRYCTAGSYSVVASVTDKDGGTGSDTRAITVTRFPIVVDVLPKKVNTRSGGTLPVAVLGAADFDARQLDLATVLLGTATDPGVPIAQRPHGRVLAETRDVNGDGITDLVLHFAREALETRGLLASPATRLVLTGTLMDHCRQVSGSDVVRVIGPKR